MGKSRSWHCWLVACLVLGCRGPAGSPLEDALEGGDDVSPVSAGAPAVAAVPPSGGAGEAQSSNSSVDGANEGGERGAAECGAQPVTLAEVHSGGVRSGVVVAVEPLVASSQKFLVSEAKSGSCLWGAMAAHPTHVGRGSGLFLVSFGEPHAAGEPCQPGTDGLPDDLEPGDRLAVSGTLDEYAPASCNGVAPAQQLRIDPACPATRQSRGEPPAAALLDVATADALATGTDAELLREWGGALVRLENMPLLADPEDADAVFPFGVMRLEPTVLEIHSRLYYFDLSEGGPRSPSKAPRFRFPLTLASVTGHIFLDYCTWALAPRSRCTDMDPPSDGCD
jgi:hypothetical protein